MKFINDTDKLDQHFLIDKTIINVFIDTMNLDKNDYVVEVGPGKGVITKEIAPLVNHLTLIEYDERLMPILSSLEKKYNNIDIIYDNVLNTYIPKCNKLVTSLPYSITEPFIEKLLRCEFDEVIMIVGKKYCDMVINNEITKLGLLTNCYFESKRIIDIPKEAFNPMPRVMSSIIKLKKKDNCITNELKIFRYLFSHRSQKIKNSLTEAIIELKGITKKESKLIVSNLDKELLSKSIENLNNNEIQDIFDFISNL